MPFTVTMPKLTPTMEEGVIALWHKKVGDKVEAGDLLVEISTDKATLEYNALDAGFLRKILVNQGERGSVNQPIAIFTVEKNESIEGYTPPSLQVKSGEPALKKSAAQPEIKVSETKPTAAPLMGVMAIAPQPPLENYTFAFPAGKDLGRIIASPLAKKLAKEKGLDLSSVKGSGPGGRISSRDLTLAQKSARASFASRELPQTIPGTYEEVPLSPMRKVVATRLQQSKASIPHFYVRQEVDVEALLALREQLKNNDLKITINDFVIRSVALALREHPEINSGFDSRNESIVLFKTIDIAVAVSVEGGLITPIIRHADYKNLGEVSVEIKELSSRAKLGKLKPTEYQGGSFTISNLGMMGVSDFVAIINPPQSALLAVAGIEDCVRMKNGKAVAGKKMNITLSLDHRVIDGVSAAKFIKTIQKYLENPAILLV